MRKIYHIILHKLAIRHHNRNIIQRLNFGRPDINFNHIPLLPGYLHPIPHANRTLEHDNQPGNKIGCDVLQSKTDPHRQQTEQKRQTRKINPEHLKRNQHPNQHNHVLAHPRKRKLQPLINLRLTPQKPINPLFHQPAQVDRRRNQNHKNHHRQHRHRCILQRKQLHMNQPVQKINDLFPLHLPPPSDMLPSFILSACASFFRVDRIAILARTTPGPCPAFTARFASPAFPVFPVRCCQILHRLHSPQDFARFCSACTACTARIPRVTARNLPASTRINGSN